MASRSSPQSQKPGTGAFLKNKDIVIISISDWEGPKRIRQFLSEELARQGNRVLFVESQYTLSKFLQKPSLSRALRFLKGPRRLSDNLFLLATFPFIPGGEFSAGISRTNWNLERSFLRQAMKRLGFRDPILWIFAYNASPLIGKLGESLSLYFCNDAFSLLVDSKSLQQRIASLEREVMGKVDLVFTVSDKLSDEKSRFHESVHTINHGVDYLLFERIARSKASRPADMPSGKPVIGYSGVIRYMLDLDLIRFLAEQKPDWDFVLVGPVSESRSEFYAQIENLKRRSNVHFLGPKRPEDLPLYINSFDACLLPYVKGEVSTYYAAPLKFYEYLAAGKPVVSTVGPKEYDRDVVINCTSPQEVLAAITDVLSKDSADRARKRKEIAKHNSWSERVRQIDAILAAGSK
ncbi:MAG: UDP-glycosyl transferase/glycogen phosphorylase [Bacteroidetes bacterium]|nr:UDP-glycosyl transferase/glycogen phosphorylase [Bacteroidota bacterium]